MPSDVSAPEVSPPFPKALNVSLWVAQTLLAAAFGMAGLMKSTVPIGELAPKLVWPG